MKFLRCEISYDSSTQLKHYMIRPTRRTQDPWATLTCQGTAGTTIESISKLLPPEAAKASTKCIVPATQTAQTWWGLNFQFRKLKKWIKIASTSKTIGHYQSFASNAISHHRASANTAINHHGKSTNTNRQTIFDHFRVSSSTIQHHQTTSIIRNKYRSRTNHKASSSITKHD